MHRLIFAAEKVEHDRGLNITTEEEAVIQLERYIAHYFPSMPPYMNPEFYFDSGAIFFSPLPPTFLKNSNNNQQS